MPQWVERIKAKPWVAHLLRMQERFTSRLGNQFAAAVTYFSVLSLVPVLMFAFSILAMVLTVFRPDLLDVIRNVIATQMQGAPSSQQLVAVMDEALNTWPTLVGVSLLIFAYSGSTWVANLKSAIRAQMRPNFDMSENKSNIVVETLKNLGILVALLVAVLAMFGLSAVATSLSDWVIHLIGLPDSWLTTLLLSLVPPAVSLLVGFCLFAFLYRVSAEHPVRRRVWVAGATAGAVVLVALQLLSTVLFSAFSGNKAIAVFGPVIVLMLFMNLFATLILMIAAWMATYEADDAVRSPFADDVPDPAPELDDPVPVVREAVAQRAVKVGMGTGWVLGAATGVGLGAIIAAVVAWFGRTFRRS